MKLNQLEMKVRSQTWKKVAYNTNKIAGHYLNYNPKDGLKVIMIKG